MQLDSLIHVSISSAHRTLLFEGPKVLLDYRYKSREHVVKL